MDIEKLKHEAQSKALHIADVSGSALFNADCMDILPLIPDKSVQLILADLPYGTTKCAWDSIIPFEELWKQYKRIIKPNGAIVLFCQAQILQYPLFFALVLFLQLSVHLVLLCPKSSSI